MELVKDQLPTFGSLYRRLSRAISALPMDQRTKTLLHRYKRYKYENTQVKNNSLYHVKTSLYYLGLMNQVTYKVADEPYQELLRLLYIKTVPTSQRFPAWLMEFLNWNEFQYTTIFNKGLWPVKHLVLDQSKKNPKMNELASEYETYLQRQKLTKNWDTKISDILLSDDKFHDNDVAHLITKLNLCKADSSMLQESRISEIILNLQDFMRKIKYSSQVDKISFKEFAIVQPPGSFGQPIPKNRAKNLLLKKIRFFKKLLYSRLEPISHEDMIHLEKVSQTRFHPQLDRSFLIKSQKRIKNFLNANYCFDKNDETSIVYSKFRVLKKDYYIEE